LASISESNIHWNLDSLIGWQSYQGCVTTEHPGPGNAVAHGKARHIGADVRDDPSTFEARGVGQRHRVEARALVGIDVVDPGSFYRDKEISRACNRVWHLCVLEDFWATGLRHAYCFHGTSLVESS
jgi:hypothetical protein